MTNTNVKIAIFLNTWANYNENGADNGFWIELPCDLDEAFEKLAEATGEDVDEMEVFINDTDIIGINLEVDENDNIEDLNEFAETIEALDNYDLEKLNAIIEATGYSIENVIDDIDNYTYYQSMTLLDVAYELIDECYDLPEIAQRYFDYEAFARDLSYDNYVETSEGVIVLY